MGGWEGKVEGGEEQLDTETTVGYIGETVDDRLD